MLLYLLFLKIYTKGYFYLQFNKYLVDGSYFLESFRYNHDLCLWLSSREVQGIYILELVWKHFVTSVSPNCFPGGDNFLMRFFFWFFLHSCHLFRYFFNENRKLHEMWYNLGLCCTMKNVKVYLCYKQSNWSQK